MTDMDLWWTKERLQKIFSKDSLPITAAHASGDAGTTIRCCRLCGGDTNLCHFSDTYVWEGIEERYDQLLFDCFGVRVNPADSMICDRCVRQLLNTQRFRALVQAAFTVAPSEFSTNQSLLGVGEGLPKKRRIRKSALDLDKKTTRTTVSNSGNRRRKLSERKSIFNSNVQVKRMNIACTVCKHKYPMIMPFEGWKSFVCSRCKKNSEPRMSRFGKCDVLTTANANRDRMEIQAKTDLRKNRHNSLPKKPSQVSKQESFLKPRHPNSQCSKRNSTVQQINRRVESTHKTVKSNNFVCDVCGRNVQSKELFDRHMRSHTGEPIYQCDVCTKVFKGKRTFQTHYLTHGK